MNKYNHLICTLRKQMFEGKKEFCFSVMPTRYDVSTANISFECSLSWLPFSWAFAASFHFVRSFYSIHASYNRAAPYDCFIFPIAPVCMCLTTFPFGRCSCYSGQFFFALKPFAFETFSEHHNNRFSKSFRAIYRFCE